MSQLSAAERQFLTFALGLAADHMANRGDEFTDEDDAVPARLRQLAAEPASGPANLRIAPVAPDEVKAMIRKIVSRGPDNGDPR